jgi:hypothetical protein
MKPYKKQFNKNNFNAPYLDVLRKYKHKEIDYSDLQDIIIQQNKKDGLLGKYFPKEFIRKMKEFHLYEMSIIKTLIDELIYHVDVKDIHDGGENWFIRLVNSCSAVYGSSLSGYINSGKPEPSFTHFIQDSSKSYGKKDYQRVLKLNKADDFWKLVNEIETVLDK